MKGHPVTRVAFREPQPVQEVTVVGDSIGVSAKAEDLTGRKFGLWEVLGPTNDRKRGYKVWLCRCACGHEAGVHSMAIRMETPHSCGCTPLKGGPRLKDLSGTTTPEGIEILRRLPPNPARNSRQLRYECRCPCGRVWVVDGSDLRAGRLRSCGCRSAELIRAARTTHGMSSDRVYRIYQSMLQRCHSATAVNYADYGGRGIVVCDRWRESFENFFADMGAPPTKYHSLDRYPDNDGNYEPGNCRWATTRQQSSNRRNTIRMTRDGTTRPLVEWARAFGVPDVTLRWWLRAHGAEEAFRRAEEYRKARIENPDAFD